ncbi:MAG: DUF882 domain-containing protein [Pseudomonadota bacterium]
MIQADWQKSGLQRRGVLALATGLLAATAAPQVVASPSILRGAGDIRRLHLSNPRTGDKLDTVYWVDGEYIPEAKSEIDFLLRDWRENLIIDFDIKTVDILAGTYRLLEASEPISIVSGYRSPVTNAMLRRRNRGVAKDSYHTKGMAIDLQMKSRAATTIRRAAKRVSGGGVGGYRSFTHIDSGPVRAWGRS